jgi:exodeoxyribonuclease V alpha subunit
MFDFKKLKKYSTKIKKIIHYEEFNDRYELLGEDNRTYVGSIKEFSQNTKITKEKMENYTLECRGNSKIINGKEVIKFIHPKVIDNSEFEKNELVVVVERVIWFNEDSNYYILNTDKGVIKGQLIHTYHDLKDISFLVQGEWKKSNQGMSFEFNNIKSLDRSLYTFLTKYIKGIGPKLATKLLDIYGEDKLRDILNENQDELLNVKGLKEKKLRKIKTHWDDFNYLEDLTVMIGLDYGMKTIIKIFNYFGNKSIDIIKENPYRLAEIKSIGFKIADKIKNELNIEVDSMFRVIAGLSYTIDKDMNDNGNTYITYKDLFKLTSEELNIVKDINDQNDDTIEEFILGDSLFKKGLDELENSNTKDRIIYLDKEKTLIANAEYYKMEKYIYEFTKKHNNIENQIQIIENIDKYIEDIQIEMNMQFSDEQKEEIKIANKGYKFISLSGYAGSGKSTISKAIINLLTKKYNPDNVICTAISGMAANRIKETSGFEASTMHSLLKFSKGKFEYNENNKLPFDIILLDEASMVNTFLFYSFLKAIDKNTMILVVGDPAQLPPIGPGNIYSDIISQNLIPGTTLTKIYRQSEDAVITHFASYIRKGIIPENLNGKFEDFKITFINNSWDIKNLELKEQKIEKEKNQLKIAGIIKSEILSLRNEILTKFKNKDAISFIKHFQLITAMKGGILGTINLNKLAQSVLNYREEESEYPHLKIYNNTELRIRDKVLHKRNANMTIQSLKDYKSKPFEKNNDDKRIYNGQLGIIISIDKDMEEVHILYPNENIVVLYTFNEARDYLDLAYALTIHKTQGSEFNNVIIPLVNAHYVMLNNQLLYTALTRAKENVYIIGHNYAFEKAVTTKSNELRKTILKYISN